MGWNMLARWPDPQFHRLNQTQVTLCFINSSSAVVPVLLPEAMVLRTKVYHFHIFSQYFPGSHYCTVIWFDLFWLHSFFTHFFAVLITLDMFGHDIFLSFLIYIAFLFFDHLPIYYCITKDSLHLLGTLSAEKGQGWQSVNLHFCRRSRCSMMQLPQTSNVVKPVDCRNSCIQYQSGQKRWHLWSRTLYI